MYIKTEGDEMATFEGRMVSKGSRRFTIQKISRGPINFVVANDDMAMQLKVIMPRDKVKVTAEKSQRNVGDATRRNLVMDMKALKIMRVA